MIQGLQTASLKNKLIAEPVAELTLLQAYNTSSTETGVMISCAENGILYTYNANSSDEESLPFVVKPNSITHPNPGRWIALTGRVSLVVGELNYNSKLDTSDFQLQSKFWYDPTPNVTDGRSAGTLYFYAPKLGGTMKRFKTKKPLYQVG